MPGSASPLNAHSHNNHSQVDSTRNKRQGISVRKTLREATRLLLDFVVQQSPLKYNRTVLL